MKIWKTHILLTKIWITKNNMKSCQYHKSSEKQIKTTMNYHFTLARMAIIKRPDSNCWWRCAEIGILIHSSWQYKLVQLLRKAVWKFLKVKCRVTYYPIFLIIRSERICPQKKVYINIYGTIIYDSQKVETVQTFNSCWMDKHIWYNSAMEYYSTIKRNL